MIIKDREKRPMLIISLLWAMPLLLLAFLFSKTSSPTELEINADLIDTLQENKLLFSADLEQENGSFFTAGKQLLDGVVAKNSEHAFSGDFSIALNSQNLFGLTTWFFPPSHEATYHLSVRRYNPFNVDSYLVVAAENAKQLYRSVKEGRLIDAEDDKWETLDLLFQVPPDVDSVKIYCYVADGLASNVYFDDLSLSMQDLESVSKIYNVPRLDLKIDESGLMQLNQKRTEAWKVGILVKEDDDWVKSKVIFKGDEMNARLRLKGDWLDHLRGDKWSFRIKLKDPNALWGMTTFNVQKPDTRGHLHEWIYHQMLNDHAILSPRYEFVLLYLNGKSLGFYAIEEHFEKELVESQYRKEGPIFKFSEDRMWNGMQRQFEDYGKNRFPLEHDKENAFHSAPIESFDEPEDQAISDLSMHYRRGLELMHLYKSSTVPSSQIFDPDLLGKYLAIIDLCEAYHSLTWHNQRFYYNPLSDKLEPIGYDGFAAEKFNLSPGMTLIAEEALRVEKDRFEPYKHLFNDPVVVSSYCRYLDSLSSTGYVEGFFSEHKSEIDAYAESLEEEYHVNVFTQKDYADRAARIRLTVPAYPESLQLYKINNDEVFVINNHVLPIEIVGRKVSGPLIWPVSNAREGKTISYTTGSQKTLNFRVLGTDSEVTSPLRPFAELVKMKDVAIVSDDPLHPLCVAEGDHFTLLSGTTDKPILVPPRTTLLVNPGTELNLNSGAYLLCSGPVYFGGEEDLPIKIFSEDGTGAVVVRQTAEISKVEHVIFDGLGRVNDDGFLLTGGVTFYQADVDFTSCVFRNNTQEDALNVVRSNFHLRKCVFENTAYDAFDADFCTGILEDCYFLKTGNDAIDFSGSQASINNCMLQNIGDKGVSVGEHSTVHITQISIDKAVIGVASKDLSTLTIDFIDLKNVGTAFTAYQKKPSFGPATITVNTYKVKNTPRLHLIERNSSILFENGPIL